MSKVYESDIQFTQNGIVSHGMELSVPSLFYSHSCEYAVNQLGNTPFISKFKLQNCKLEELERGDIFICVKEKFLSSLSDRLKELRSFGIVLHLYENDEIHYISWHGGYPEIHYKWINSVESKDVIFYKVIVGE